jgi:mRNA-degrading endonuclease RelE of RelBE toxin-antitoxin system
MTDIEKALARLDPEFRKRIILVFELIRRNELGGLDVIKLGGTDRRYRVRVGQWRINFTCVNGANIIKRFGRRDEKTYRDL